jgi:hypothetical protein
MVEVASDLFEHNKQSYLFVVDYYSRYIEIAKLHSTSSNAVINHLKSIFTRHGIPQTFISDNGPQYCGNAFREFAKSYGFEHITRTFSRGRLGNSEHIIGSALSLLVSAHVLQFLTTSSSCLLIPSHQTVFLARSRHFTIPCAANKRVIR